MKRIDFELSTKDKFDLSGYCWQPGTGVPKAVVAMVHGMGEHIMRYNEWAGMFVNQGYAFTGMDNRGHGKSEGKRGHIPSYEALLDDVDLLIDKTKELFPGKQVFLYGHSLGGNIVLNYSLKRSGKLKYIVTSPWLRLSFKPSSLKLLLAKTLEKLLPGLQQPSGLDVERLSHNPEVARAYRNDPMTHDKISLRMFTTVTAHGEWALANAGKLSNPLLLMHGGDDRITSADASKRFEKKAGKYVTLKIWEDMYHELHNEEVKDEVFNYIIEWLEKNRNVR